MKNFKNKFPKLFKWIKRFFYFFLTILIIIIGLIITLDIFVYFNSDGYSYHNNVAEINKIGMIEFNKWKMGDENFFFLDHTNNDLYGNSIIKFIEKIDISEKNIYVIGEMGYFGSSSSTTGHPLKLVHMGIIGNDENFLKFDNKEEMPRYLKLDTKTANEQWFHTLDEMSPEDRQIFENLPPVQFNKRAWNPFR